jgi:hypothetical protein
VSLSSDFTVFAHNKIDGLEFTVADEPINDRLRDLQFLGDVVNSQPI